MNPLFVCSRNRRRSPTPEAVFSKLEGRSVLSAGSCHDAENPVSQRLNQSYDYGHLKRAGSTLAKLITVATLLLPSAAVLGQDASLFVILPASAIAAAPAMKSTMFSHGTWAPSKADINGLEARLSDLAALKDGMWGPNVERRIDHPERYHRQYVPVVVAGKRLIYINAFCEPPPTNWHDHLYVVFDGATCFWQALYDPSTATFSHLAINARA